jgi:hypothetical protein
VEPTVTVAWLVPYVMEKPFALSRPDIAQVIVTWCDLKKMVLN